MIFFAKPQPFAEALAALRQRTLLPTSGGSADLETLRASVRERAFFSAKVRSAGHLDVIRTNVEAIVEGKTDFATARLNILQHLRASGHVAPKGEEGTLQDFASRQRIDLQLQMNVQQAQSYGNWKQGQDPDLLDAFPARAFERVEDREKPRDDWEERWNEARQATTADGATDSESGEMVALVGHPIWEELNRFGLPYGPFDYGSGMDQVDRSRSEAMELGLIGRDTQIFPQDRPFNESLQATPQVKAAGLRALLEERGVGYFEGDVLHFAGGGA